MAALKVKMKAAHPGAFVREWVVPEGMTVSAAAKHLGVGRQALDALLNERAALSPEMALRLESAFGASMDALLRMQLQFDSERMRARAAEIKLDVEPYRPSRRSPARASA